MIPKCILKLKVGDWVIRGLQKGDFDYHGVVVGVRKKRVPTGMSRHVVMVRWPSGSVGRHEETQLIKVNPK